MGLTEDLDAFAYLIGRALGLNLYQPTGQSRSPVCLKTKNTAEEKGAGGWHGLREGIADEVIEYVRSQLPNDRRVYEAVEARYHTQELGTLSERAALALGAYRDACTTAK